MSSVSREKMLDRARSLVRVFSERSASAEDNRMVSEESIQDLHELGLWRVNQPKRVGGPELDVQLLIEITAILASGCASTGWVYVNLAVHHWMLSMWPHYGQSKVWNENPDALIASSVIYPLGAAKKVKEGYLLSGRWPFCSGVNHSDWTILGGLAESPDSQKAGEARMFLVPTSDIEILDTWDVVGLAATGSHDVQCTELLVPFDMTLAAADTRGGPTPGSELNPSPLYQQSVGSLFPHLISGVLLGIGEGMYDFCLAHLKAQNARTSGARLAALSPVQARLSEAGVHLSAARQLLLSNLKESQSIAEAGKVPEIEDKLRWRRDGAFVARLVGEAGQNLRRLMGSGSIFRRNAFQRMARDLDAGLTHAHVSWDINGPAFGRVALGLPPDNPNL